MFFDPDFDLAVLRTTAPLGPALTIDPNLVWAAPRPPCWVSRGRPLTTLPASVTEEVTAIGKDIYNNGSVTLWGVLHRRQGGARELGGPLMGPGGR